MMNDLDKYMEGINELRLYKFKSIMAHIQNLYPAAELSMKYKMPTYCYGQGWIALANQKNYISVYTCAEKHLLAFKKLQPQIKTGKGCINFKDRDGIKLESLTPVIISALENSK
jgi:uncharacterized protein YdhG (YjbR/CyaY superfamily)